jgi:hypothetical protein
LIIDTSNDLKEVCTFLAVRGETLHRSGAKRDAINHYLTHQDIKQVIYCDSSTFAIIDDSPKNIMDCRPSVKKAILFNFNSSYPWLDAVDVSSAKNWPEIISMLHCVTTSLKKKLIKLILFLLNSFPILA